METYTSWLTLPVAGCWVTAQGYVWRLCGDLNAAWRLSFSDEMRVRGVLYMKCAIQINVFTFYLWAHRYVTEPENSRTFSDLTATVWIYNQWSCGTNLIKHRDISLHWEITKSEGVQTLARSGVHHPRWQTLSTGAESLVILGVVKHVQWLDVAADRHVGQRLVSIGRKLDRSTPQGVKHILSSIGLGLMWLERPTVYSIEHSLVI